MRRWIALPLLFACLSGCDQHKQQSENASDSIEESSIPPIFLNCKGAWNDSIFGPKAETRLLSMPQSSGVDQHIIEYDIRKKLYFSVCNNDCYLEIEDAFFRERGYTNSNSGVTSAHTIFINRLTGEIEERVTYDMTVLKSFNGICKPTDPPPRSQAQF